MSSKEKAGDVPSPSWLIATMSAAQSVQRRAIIRSTWQALYKNETIFRTRFVLSNPGELWAPVIAVENATHGDIILLPHLKEDAHTANTVKSIEFLKYLTSNSTSYDFVTKLDDDSYLDAHNFWKNYLEPRIAFDANKSPAESSALKRTIIARTLRRSTWTYPGGQFYTMTWDMVSLLAQLHDEHPINDEHEDVLIGRLLHEAGLKWQHADLPNEVAFDYEEKDLRGDGTAFAKADADLKGWRHAIGRGSVNPHKMKEDEEYLRVAACFDEEGVIMNSTTSKYLSTMANQSKERPVETSLSEKSSPRKQQQSRPSIDQHQVLTTTFLSLPREIRQKILVQTFDSTAHRIRYPIVPGGPITHSEFEKLKQQEKKFGVRRMWIEGERKKIKTLASSLASLHPVIEEDMSFVLVGWEKQVEGRLEDLEDMQKQFQDDLKHVVKVADPIPAQAQAPAPAQAQAQAQVPGLSKVVRERSPEPYKRVYHDNSVSPSPAPRIRENPMASLRHQQQPEKACSIKKDGKNPSFSKQSILKPTDRSPTTFLDLPREIRQMIIALSYGRVYAYHVRVPEIPKPAPNVDINGAKRMRKRHLERRLVTAAADLKRAENWTCLLMGVHSSLQDEIEYVHEQQTKVLNEDVEEWKAEHNNIS
ncbi:hypothetical protein FKW77_001924 [Venturia effusa]|uniref:Hexosyltransferase n=1 Tax=Venturia effusa TaxID=50376 RepID=A0A517L8P4_9PEZI|nr:hypothetical protein FKW77_001924 [Venturia effusa]